MRLFPDKADFKKSYHLNQFSYWRESIMPDMTRKVAFRGFIYIISWLNDIHSVEDLFSIFGIRYLRNE